MRKNRVEKPPGSTALEVGKEKAQGEGESNTSPNIENLIRIVKTAR